MGIVNHLKVIDARNTFRTVAYGRHVVTGILAKSLVTGASPTHQITIQQALGRDEWEGVDGGIYWNNISIPSTDWVFHPGKLSSGNSDALQGVDTVFDKDVPHSLVPWMRLRLPSGVGDFNTLSSPPFGFQGYFKTKKVNNYNSSGTVTDFSYSTNAARQVADLILKQSRLSPDLIDWGAWTEWRDFLAEEIICDYRAIPGFDGFGLTAVYYSGTNFNTFHSKRVDALVSYLAASGSPAYGLSATSMSAKFEGYVKLKYNETYTFYLTHTNGGRLTVDGDSVIINQFATDGTTAPGTHSGTFNFGTTGFMAILAEWNRGNSTGTAEIKLEWQSASQTREVIPTKYLYPRIEVCPRYETHPFFSTRTRLDDAVRTVLNLCNSTYQKVNGKYRFFCVEQLTESSYTFTENEIISITPKPRDKANLRNRWSATFRDIDSRFLEQVKAPFIIERPALQALAGRPIDGDDIEFFNCTRFQAWRLLNRIVSREVDTLPIELVGNGSTFPVLSGDRVKITSEIYNWTNKEFFVLTSNDASSEETADERNFTMQTWMANEVAPLPETNFVKDGANFVKDGANQVVI